MAGGQKGFQMFIQQFSSLNLELLKYDFLTHSSTRFFICSIKIKKRISSPVSTVTSNNLATKYRLSGGPLARNKLPLSAYVSKHTFIRILWQRTSMSNSVATSRINSMKKSPSSREPCNFLRSEHVLQTKKRF